MNVAPALDRTQSVLSDQTFSYLLDHDHFYYRSPRLTVPDEDTRAERVVVRGFFVMFLLCVLRHVCSSVRVLLFLHYRDLLRVGRRSLRMFTFEVVSISEVVN